MSASNRHKLNGKDLYDTWGVLVNLGSAMAMAQPKRKPNLFNDWVEESGKEYYLGYVAFEDKTVNLQIGFVANTAAQLRTNRDNFYAELCKTGWQDWHMVDNGNTYKVFYVEEQNLRKANGRLENTTRPAMLSTLVLEVAVGDAANNPVILQLGLGITQSNVTSYGGSNGSVTLQGTGGSGSYEYNFNGSPYTTPRAGSFTFPNLPAGTYNASVRDANNPASVVTRQVKIEQPAGTESSIALNINKTTGTLGTPESILLDWVLLPGNESQFTGMVLEQRNTATNNSFVSLQTLTGTSGTVPYTADKTTSFRAKMFSESGLKESPIRTITFNAPSITVQYGWSTSNPADNLGGVTYQGNVTLNSPSSPIITDMRNGDMQYLYWKVPAIVNRPTSWNDGTLDGSTFTAGTFNYGQIPDFVFAEIIEFNGFFYVVTRTETSTTQASNSRFRLS